MPRFRDLSIKTKLIILATASGCVALLLCCLGFVFNDVRTIRAAKVRELQAQADVLGFNCSAVLTFHDAAAANQLLESLHLQPSIEYACLLDAEGAVLASYSKKSGATRSPMVPKNDGHRFTESGYLELSRHVVDDGNVVGTLYLCSNMDDLESQLWDYARIATIVMLCSFVASVLLSVALQRTISVPVLRLAETAKRISSDGDYSVRVSRCANDELGSLYVAFNHMLNQIQASEEALRKAHDELEDRVKERTAQLRTEIAERERTQEELIRAKDAAEAASRAKSEFLANMSHEIRTPLNGVLGFTELLRKGADGGDEAERQDYLQTIRTSGRHLLNLINDILDLSKVESGRMEVERIRCSPHHVIAEVVSVLRARAQERELTLECDWSGGVPESIQTDPARLRQLLMNLAGNAIKFTKSGGVEIHAKLLDVESKPKLMIEVADTGVGIAPDKLDDIFDPFVQADSSVTREFGGTGLGLAISRRIVESLDGALTVQSEIGKGTVFTATIDTGSLDAVQIKDAPPADGLQSMSPRKKNSAQRLPPAKILLVEDGSTNRKLIGLVLRRAGAEVTTAENGQIGVELATSNAFDVILMDMQMPVLDGYAASTRLRQQGVTVPIIALTAHAMKGDEEKCRAAGCCGYLTKPLDMDLLVETVAKSIPAADLPGSHAESSSLKTSAERPALISSLPSDDPDFREIVEEFVDRLEEQIQAMNRAWAAQDLTELGQLAHWLKGSGGMAGFAAFTAPAGRLERLAKNEQLDEIENALGQIVDLNARIAVAPPDGSGCDRQKTVDRRAKTEGLGL